MSELGERCGPCSTWVAVEQVFRVHLDGTSAPWRESSQGKGESAGVTFRDNFTILLRF